MALAMSQTLEDFGNADAADGVMKPHFLAALTERANRRLPSKVPGAHGYSSHIDGSQQKRHALDSNHSPQGSRRCTQYCLPELENMT